MFSQDDWLLVSFLFNLTLPRSMKYECRTLTYWSNTLHIWWTLNACSLFQLLECTAFMWQSKKSYLFCRIKLREIAGVVSWNVFIYTFNCSLVMHISCCSVTVFILCHPYIFCFQLLSKTDSDDLMNISSAKHQLSGNQQACILRYHIHTDFKRKLI